LDLTGDYDIIPIYEDGVKKFRKMAAYEGRIGQLVQVGGEFSDKSIAKVGGAKVAAIVMISGRATSIPH
jgi:hypothetical protein